MTMPHLMNCLHSEDGWCLECVKELHQQHEQLQDEEVIWDDKMRMLGEKLEEWQRATNCQTPEEARRHIEACHDVLDDIACDYNINEGAEGEAITPGHKRCVDMAETFLKSIRNRQATLDS